MQELGAAALPWVHGQSNLLGVTVQNPGAGDVHPCRGGSSGAHVQCQNPLCWKLLRGTCFVQDGAFPVSFSDVVLPHAHSIPANLSHPHPQGTHEPPALPVHPVGFGDVIPHTFGLNWAFAFSISAEMSSGDTTVLNVKRAKKTTRKANATLHLI